MALVPALMTAGAVVTMRLLTWNIHKGIGGLDRRYDPDRIVEVIRHHEPDVVLLQEVDVRSKRSAFVNELQYLLDHTDLNYGVYASGWRAAKFMTIGPPPEVPQTAARLMPRC